MNGLWKPYARQREISWARQAAKCAASPWVRGAALALGWLALVAALSYGVF